MKKILISVIAFMFILSMVSSVFAATGSISVSSSSDTVIKGKTFTVTLAGTSDTPIDGMYTKITYDKNVLSLEATTVGDGYGNNSSEGEILVTNNSSTTSPTSGTLCTMTFKVLDNANVDTTTITFSESALHLNENGTMSEFTTTIENVEINIKADDTTVGNQDEENTTTPSNTDNSNTNTTNSGNKDKDKNVIKNNNVNSNKNVGKNTSTANKTTTKLPQTGVETVSVIAIVALAVISTISYISYRRYKNI